MSANTDRGAAARGARALGLAGLLLLALGATSCFDPIVGYPCAERLTACGAACVDLSSSPGNCGACGQVCPGQCVQGHCAGGTADAGAIADAPAGDRAGAGDGSAADDGGGATDDGG